MNALYNLGISLYGMAINVAALRSDKVRRLRQGQSEAIDYLCHAIDPARRYVWVHAASAGEFEQARPMIELIKRNHPDVGIVLTFFSPSGYETKNGFKQADVVSYLPLDRHHSVCRFLDVVRPSMAIFVKYEFWGNYLTELKRRNVPTFIISAIFRGGQPFFKPWGGMFRRMLGCFTHIYVQDEPSRELLASIGVDNATVAGDTRFDRVTDIMHTARPVAAAEAMISAAGEGAITIVAGSTWPPDEDRLLPCFNSHPELRLIIAPHEVTDAHVEAIECAVSRPCCRLSTATADEASRAHCLIVDCYGMLSSIYTYGRIAYVGGGFGVGIHNINEAAVYGMPVVFGPNHHKFKEATDMIDAHGAFAYSTDKELNDIIDGWIANPDEINQAGERAGRYVADNIGATERIYADLSPLISSISQQ